MLGFGIMGLIGYAASSPAAEFGDAPVLVSHDYDLADTMGGDTITTTGTNLAGATSVSVGGVSATLVDSTSTTVTWTMPERDPGMHDVVVTTPAGASNALSIEAWSESVASLTLLQLPPYAGSPWAGSGSAGSSGSRSLSGASPPTVSGAVSVTHAASFDSAESLDASGTLSTYHTASAYSGSLLVYARTVVAGGANGTKYLKPCLLADSSAYFVVAITDQGVTLEMADGVGAPSALTVACATGGWHLVQYRYTGTQLQLRVNGGSWSSATYGSLGGVGGTLRVGTNYAKVAFFDGLISRIALANTSLDDTTMNKFLRLYRCKYRLALT